MSIEAIKLILEEKIGLNPESVGDSSIQRAITHRLTQLKITDIIQYHALLLGNSKELRELIEEIIVPETWFFRNKKPFEAFHTIFNQHILPNRNKKKKIRILSIPCSTGEEPYSLAIVLHERGMHPKDVEITAVDISHQAIAKAKRATYTKNAFRDTDDDRVDKYFDKRGTEYQIIESIQDFVKFKHKNVFMGSLSPHPGYFDVIFCRNLLIYFDYEKQQIVLEKLHRALKTNGALFVGHAEALMVTEQNFSRHDDAQAFSFLKKAYEKNSPRKTANKSNDSTSNRLTIVKDQLSKANRAREILLKKRLSAVLKKDPYKDNALSFRPVENLITQQKNEEALGMCKEYLKRDKDSAHGYYLLALLKSKRGENKKAQSLLKKVIYLDQNHKAALMLSLELARQDGDTEATTSFQRRIDRITKQSKGSL